MKRWDWRQWISAGEPPQSSIPRYAREMSEICNQSWSMTSSRGLPGALTPMFTPAFSMGVPITTKLKLCSRPLRVHCALPVPATGVSRKCCPVPRDFYDCHCGLWRGQHQLCEESTGRSEERRVGKEC